MLVPNQAPLHRLRHFRNKMTIFGTQMTPNHGRLSQSAAAGTIQSSTVLQHQSVRTPLCDRRTYKHDQLSNGVRVLVVQDKDAIYAAACANVQIGYFDDPQQLPGAAHFIEHMVHLGSGKYPDEKEYKAFLAQHGGSSNASTSMVHTRYHFKVHSDALAGALSRFGAMLSCPLIARESAAREVENVHAEYSRNINSDARKLLQLRRSLCQPPYSNFSTGSLQTLWQQPHDEALDVPEVLRVMWQRFYKAEATCIAVVGPQEPDVLLQMVADAFADMPSSRSSSTSSAVAADPADLETLDKQSLQEQQQHLHSLHIQQVEQQCYANNEPSNSQYAAATQPEGQQQQHRYPADVVSAGSRGLLVRVAPQRDLRDLELSWYLPLGVMAHSSVKPWQWASHLLGHEGPGSVAHLLKSQGLVQSLEVGMGEEVRLGKGWMFWRVQISLSQAGEDALEHVVASVFRAIQVLQRCTDEQLQQTWQEAATLAQLRFDWRDPSEPLTCAQSASYALHYYPPAETLSGAALMTQYNPAVLRWFVNQLSPENVNVYYSSKRNVDLVDCKEQWYGARYAVQQLPQSWLDTMARYLAADGGAAAGANQMDDASCLLQQQQHLVLEPVPGELHLPDPNWALPSDLSLRCEPGKAAAAAQQEEESQTSGSSHDSAAQQAGAAAVPAASFDGALPLPDVLMEQPGLCVWHQRDISYGLPKVHLKLHLVSLAVYASPESTISTRLLLRVLDDLLLPQSYPAELAGTSYSLSSEPGGLVLKLVGFPGVTQQLLKAVLQGLLELTPQQVQERFATMSGRLLQALKNWANNNPAQHAEYGAHHLLHLHHHHNEALLAAAAAAAPEHLLALQRQLTSGDALHIDMLAYGNISRTEAVELVGQLQQLLQPKGLPAGCWPPARRVLCLSPPVNGHACGDVDYGSNHTKTGSGTADVDIISSIAGFGGNWTDVAQQQESTSAAEQPAAASEGSCGSSTSAAATAAVYVTYLPSNPNPSNSNSAVYYTVQLGPDTVSTSVLLDLFVQMSSKACFHELRTKQRLGYSVSLSSDSLHRQLGLMIRVQSPTTLPDVLAEAVRGWLSGFRQELTDMAAQQLQQHKKALAAKYLEPAKSLQEAARRTWIPIHSRSLVFDRRQQKAAAVEALPAEQLLQFYDECLHPDGPGHKALCVQIWGGGKTVNEAATTAVEGNAAVPKQLQQQLTVLAGEEGLFKRGQPLMPVAGLQPPPHL